MSMGPQRSEQTILKSLRSHSMLALLWTPQNSIYMHLTLKRSQQDLSNRLQGLNPVAQILLVFVFTIYILSQNRS